MIAGPFMPLPGEIRDLADRILGRLDEARDFFLHTQRAWRLVQQIAHEGRSVGIVDTATDLEVPATDLESLAQRHVTVHLSESTFKSLSALVEDWIVGLAPIGSRGGFNLSGAPGVGFDVAFESIEAADR